MQNQNGPGPVRKLSAAIALVMMAPLAPVALAQGAMIEEVVVTGSRIARDSATASASPVAVVDGGDIRMSGTTDIAEYLRDTPALNQSLPAKFSSFTDAGTTDSDIGLGLLDLRGLGTVRTLVLVNGRRHVAGSEGSAAVDTNTIPNVMVSRVETLTGGASSVYGADAVTGVVNFIMRDGGDFDGLELSARMGLSDRGDSDEFMVSAAGGFEFMEGRGEIVFGAEYLRNEEVFAFERGFTGPNQGSSINNTPELAAATGLNPDSPRLFLRDRSNPISSPLGVFDLSTIDSFGSIDSFISNNPGDTPIPFFPGTQIPILQVIDSPTNGVPRAYNPGRLFSNTSQSWGIGDGLGTTLTTLFPKQDRYVLNVNGSFAINESVSVFFESKYVNTENSRRAGGGDFNDAIPIAYDNPYIPPALASQITELQGLGIIPPNPMDGSFYGFGSSRDTQDLEVLPGTSVERETLRLVFGVEGVIPVLDGIDFELSYNYGETTADVTNINVRLEDRFYAALDSVVDPSTGEIVCRSDLDPTALPWVGATFPTPEFSTGNFTNNGRMTDFISFEPGDGSCVPFNPFGRNAATRAYSDFAYVNTRDRTQLEQNVIFASLSGTTSSFFELPAGPIGWAAGIEYREEKSRFRPSDEELSQNTWVGSRRTERQPVEGKYDVIEYFVEAQVPLLENLPGVDFLELNGAYRYADYSTTGTNDAWTVGGRWSPGFGLTLRSAYSEAVRAPNINELFSPRQPVNFPFLNDPCTIQNINSGSEFRAQNCAQFVPDGYDVTQFITAGIPGVTGGNPNLSEEEASTFTVGFVFEPDALPGLRIIVDYYDIEITGAIDALAPRRVAEACVDLPTTDNAFCDLIQRDPTQGFITFHESGQVNLGSLETQGVDFAVSYSFSLGDYGRLRLGVTGSHLLDFDEFQDPIDRTVVQSRVGEFAFPDWIVNTSASWMHRDLTLGWSARYEASQLLPGIENVQVDANPIFSDPLRTGSSIVHNFNFGYQVNEKFEFFGGLNNAFDKSPYLGTLARPAGPRGRFFFAGLNYRM